MSEMLIFLRISFSISLFSKGLEDFLKIISMTSFQEFLIFAGFCKGLLLIDLGFFKGEEFGASHLMPLIYESAKEDVIVL